MSDVELPPLDTDPGEWDDHWDTKTTITVSRWVKAMLDADRDSQPWDSYLNKLRRQKADPLTFTEVEAIADHLEEQLSLTVGEDLAIDFPVADVKEAVREVLREELPEGALR